MSKTTVMSVDNLLSAMDRLGVTEEELAEYTKLDLGAIRRWTSEGLLPKDPAFAMSVTLALGCSLDYILGLETANEEDDVRVDMYNSVCRAIEAFSNYPENLDGDLPDMEERESIAEKVEDHIIESMADVPLIRQQRVNDLAEAAGISIYDEWIPPFTCDYYGHIIDNYEDVYLPDRSRGRLMYLDENCEWVVMLHDPEEDSIKVENISDLEERFSAYGEFGSAAVICRADASFEELEEFFVQ